MADKIGSIVAELRKERRLTQEQLAKALGVSIAAVSKWECDISYPDITLLPSIATFFDVSIDTLFGQEVQPGQAQRYRDQLLEHVKRFDLIAGLTLAEDALLKYPNDFDILRYSATLRMFKANSCECDTDDKERLINQAVDGFLRALTVRPPNSPVRPEQLKSMIAVVYGDAGKHDQAIAILEEINVQGVMNDRIAHHLLRSGRSEAAKSKLQDFLWSFAFSFGTLVDNLNECFKAEGSTDLTIDLQQLHAVFSESLTGATSSYADLICVWSFFRLATYQREAKNIESMWGSLAKGVHYALRFDTNPKYELSSIKFMGGAEGYLGNASSSHACHEAINRLKNEFAEYSHDERYVKWIQELETSAKDKCQSGEW